MASLRELGYCEIMENFINKVTPHNIVVCGKIKGHIENDTLIEALENTKIKNPLLHTKITFNNGIYIYDKLPSESKIMLNYYIDNDIILNEHKKIQQLIATQLSEDGLPLARLEHVRATEYTYLFFAFQHTISDGISASKVFLELMQELDVILGGTKIKISKCEKKLVPPLEHFVFDKKINIKCPPEMDKENHKLIISSLSTGVYSIQLSEIETSNFLVKCKSKEVSVTSMLSCLMLKKLHEQLATELKSHDVRCNILVDMRRYLNNIDINEGDLGFYSSCIPLLIKHIDKFDTVENIALDINKKINTTLRSGVHLTTIVNYKSLVEESENLRSFMNKIKVESPSVGVSNMGIITTEKFKNIILDDMHLSCGTHAYGRTSNNFFSCINSYNNKLYINLLYPTPAFPEEKIKIIGNNLRKSIIGM